MSKTEIAKGISYFTKKKHICDGGDDMGLVDCLKCEMEMLEHFKNTAKRVAGSADAENKK